MRPRGIPGDGDPPSIHPEVDWVPCIEAQSRPVIKDPHRCAYDPRNADGIIGACDIPAGPVPGWRWASGRDIDISLTPYDILRLKRRPGPTASEFPERYTVPYGIEKDGFADLYDVPAEEREAGKRQARDADLMDTAPDE